MSYPNKRMVSLTSETDGSEYNSEVEDASPRGRLTGLKRTLKRRIRKMEDREDSIQEMENHLSNAKKDLARLRDDLLGKNCCFEMARTEEKLNDFREVLLCATLHLENSVKNMAMCQTCRGCTCKRAFCNEEETIRCIKRDLESLRLKEQSISIETSQKPSSLEAEDVDNFRVKAVTGMAALEEMKEQLDVLRNLMKKRHQEFPNDYEKCQIEECENKFDKHRAEFDEITEGLCLMIEALSRGPVKSVEKADECKKLLADQMRILEDIKNQEKYLNSVKKDLKEVEKELCRRKAESAEQEKEIRSRNQEIANLREGVRGFRERLKEMQIEIAENLNDNCKLDETKESYSSLSILSNELQELCEILSASRSSIPRIIEKYKEENGQMKDKVNCLENCLHNKDETLILLQKSLKLRSAQVEDLNSRVKSLDAEAVKLKQEIEEKSRLICNLQESMTKAKEFELKMKNETIEGLQFEICNLNHKMKAMVKEVVKKAKESELLRDEIIYVSSKNFFLNREIDVLEPKLKKMQKSIVLYEKMVGHLQNELNNRECEVESLYGRVKSMEKELEFELKKCEQRTLEDSQCISDLNTTIKNLRNELEGLKSGKRLVSPRKSELNQRSENYKCTTARTEETLMNLKDAEDRLKYMRTDMNRSRVALEDVEEIEEEHKRNERYLKHNLEAKTAECSDLMTEVQCLQVKLKTMQGELISTKANKDCEMARLNREISRLESELELLEQENGGLKSDYKKVQDELTNMSMTEDHIKEEYEKKKEELASVLCEKKELLESVDELQKRLEELCLDNTKKEQENQDLIKECSRLKKELGEMEVELSKMRREFEALRSQYGDAMDKFKSSEKKRLNMEKLYSCKNEENANLQESKNRMEKEICEVKTENFMLKEKIRQKDKETKKLMAETSGFSQEKAKYCTKIKDLSHKIRNFEENVIPDLEGEIIRKDRSIEGYKMELQDANESGQKMREESMRVIQCTKRYLLAQRYANEVNRTRSECSSSNRYSVSNEYRELEDQLKTVIRMNECLYNELQNEKDDCHDTEPRSFSPLPWGYSNAERDNSSPEYLAESGFQSMQQSPTNMNYINDCCVDIKRSSLQWNSNNNSGRQMANDYALRRNSSLR